MRLTLALAAFLFPALTHTASGGSEVLWTIPVSPGPAGDGFWIADGAMLTDGRVVVLGREGEKVSLMVEDETGTLGEWKTLPLEGSPLNVTPDPANGLWLTGYTSDGSGPNGPSRDAAIIRLNRNGVIAWGRVFGEPNEYWAIEDAAILPTGDLVVSGDFGRERSFLARVSVAGEWQWDKTFGLAEGTRIAVNDNGDILVAAYDSNERDASPRGTLWIFSEDGDFRTKTVFDPATGSPPGPLALALDPREIDLARASTGPDPAPLTIHSLAPDGTALGEVEGLEVGPGCAPSLATDPSRLWLACAADAEVEIYRIDRATGARDRLTAAIPECQVGADARLALASTPEGLLVFGHPADSASDGCAWLLRVTP